jgi:hypothetical protein
MYFEVQILVISNNHEFNVGMNDSVKFVETWDKNSEHMHVKCKYVITIVWNILQKIKFQFYHLATILWDFLYSFF